MTTIVPVILCGGSGTRLWPRSRTSHPKSFLSLVGDETLFAQTLTRCGDRTRFADPVIVTGKAHLGHVEETLARLGLAARIVVEPEAKNTAAAIALAAQTLPDNAIMLVCPSDHHIADGGAFGEAASAAADLATQGWLVAFGIAPTAPETGFGYIRQGAEQGAGYRIARFVEKPDLETAKGFLEAGGYSWNGGIFMFRADAFLAELEKFRPALALAAAEAVRTGADDGTCFHPGAAPFSAIESESVDYAVMEQTERAAMVPVRMGWSDIGNWVALREARAGEADADGNVVRGRADLVDCSNVMVDSDGPRVSVIGLDNVIVVVDGDEVLVTSADGAQKVGKLPGAANQQEDKAG
ncbi:MAG: mannose-1-phosphate guanylyltransferase [Novosphingobium sp.]|nr:mannose-1-phosphate guanylyltransferase [Novosphingobium sp.]